MASIFSRIFGALTHAKTTAASLGVGGVATAGAAYLTSLQNSGLIPPKLEPHVQAAQVTLQAVQALSLVFAATGKSIVVPAALQSPTLVAVPIQTPPDGGAPATLAAVPALIVPEEKKAA